MDRTYLQTVRSAGIYQIFAASIRKEFHWLSSVRQPNCTGTLRCRFKEQYCPNMDLPTLGYICFACDRHVQFHTSWSKIMIRQGREVHRFTCLRFVLCPQPLHNTQPSKCTVFFCTCSYFIVNAEHCYIFQPKKISPSEKMYKIILHKS